MQFINIFMLVGLASVAIPIIIQILNRKNSRRIEWGAWIFLDKPMKKRKNRIAFQGKGTDTWEWYWLQNKYDGSAAYFALVDTSGDASYDLASYSCGVRPDFKI